MNTTALDPNWHTQLAMEAIIARRYYFAFAEIKTAMLLGGSGSNLDSLCNDIFEKVPDRNLLSHNIFYRLNTLANKITTLSQGKTLSILDVGGGEGQLASFVHNHHYCLAEPINNGISGLNLPFEDGFFDVVISCHVLEHIPIRERDSFLDNLLSKSRIELVLLNPFHIAGFDENESLNAIFKITGAQWAKEHLDCTLPTIEYIYEYAYKRGLSIESRANGFLATSIAVEFMDYMADKSGAYSEWSKITKNLNTVFKTGFDNSTFPTALLVSLSRKPVENLSENKNSFSSQGIQDFSVEKLKKANSDLKEITAHIDEKIKSKIEKNNAFREDITRAEEQLLLLKDLFIDDIYNDEIL